MASQTFDRRRLTFEPLANRDHKIHVDRDLVYPDAPVPDLPQQVSETIARLADALQNARRRDAARILAFGAHTIKNGLAPLLIDLIRAKWITHLATNGAGMIHDWELAYHGATSEDVKRYLAEGRFGAWEETGHYLNLAIALGAYHGLGYGESVGKIVFDERLTVPDPHALRHQARQDLDSDADHAAAALDLARLIEENGIAPGADSVPHPHKAIGLQAAAYALGVPYTAHPMFGHDIIYQHPANCGAAIGRTAERDFLRFVASVERLEGGVYISIGSAVMSPMIFEKALSMVRNAGAPVTDFDLIVVDLAPATWDWTQGEPPEDHPAYYQRYNKSFSRTGGRLRYISADNRGVLLALGRALGSTAPA